METYGQRLRRLRRKHFPTQEAMAAALGKKRQGNLSQYERDKKRPDPETVLAHADALGIKPSEFLRDVIVTEYDRIKAGEYDSKESRAKTQLKQNASGEAQRADERRRRGA